MNKNIDCDKENINYVFLTVLIGILHFEGKIWWIKYSSCMSCVCKKRK
jgi:hypothetical protein